MLSLGERWTRYGVPAAVAGVFAAFWAVAVVVSDQPRTFGEQVQYAISWAIFAAPPVIAAGLLSRAWWSGSGGCGTRRVVFPPGSGRVAASAVVVVAVTAVISFVAVVVPVLASAVIAWLSRSFRASIQVAVWATALGTPLMFVRWLLEAPHWQQHRAGLLLDSHAAPIGQNLADAITWLFVVLPVWALSFAVIGTAIAIAVRRRLCVVHDPCPPPQGDTILV